MFQASLPFFPGSFAIAAFWFLDFKPDPLLGEKITTFVTSYNTVLTDTVTRGTKNL
jgi:hypothetical protein